MFLSKEGRNLGNVGNRDEEHIILHALVLVETISLHIPLLLVLQNVSCNSLGKIVMNDDWIRLGI